MCPISIFVIILLVVLFIQLGTKNGFTGPDLKWSIFLQTHRPVDIEGWLKHHFKLKPNMIYIVVENDDAFKVPEKYKDKVYVEYTNVEATGKTWGSDLDDRLSYNFNRMADKARKEGIEWQIKIDDDELLYSANKKKIKDTLAGVSTNSIRIQNYEAYFPQVNKKEGECFVEDAKFLDCTTSNCTAYANGKSFGRISNPQIKQSGSHFMSGPNTSMEFVPIDDLSILHFESCSYPKWREKFNKMNKDKEGEKQLVYSDFRGSLDKFFTDRFPHYAKSLHAFDDKKPDEKKLIKTYSDMKLLNTKQDYKSFKFKEGFTGDRLDLVMNYT